MSFMYIADCSSMSLKETWFLPFLSTSLVCSESCLAISRSFPRSVPRYDGPCFDSYGNILKRLFLLRIIPFDWLCNLHQYRAPCGKCLSWEFSILKVNFQSYSAFAYSFNLPLSELSIKSPNLSMRDFGYREKGLNGLNQKKKNKIKGEKRNPCPSLIDSKRASETAGENFLFFPFPELYLGENKRVWKPKRGMYKFGRS